MKMKMKMKMSAVAVVVLLLLLLCCFSSSDSADVCDQYAAVGDTVTIQLKHKRTGSESLKWMKENDIILYWRNDKFITKKQGDINKDGSLKLTNVTKADQASYKPEVYKSDKTSVGTLPSTRLCVLERVRKPQVKFTCKELKKVPKVEFTCIAEKNTDVQLEWLQNDKVVGKTSTLKLNVTKAENEAVACKVSNRVSFMISDSVTHDCYKSGGVTFPEKLFGIDIWIIVGGGAGIVLLLIILVIICCLRARRKKQMRLKDEEELRLEFTRPEQHPQYSHPADRHQHHHHQHHQHHQHQHRHHQQQPAGHTGPRQHRSKQHRNQPLPKTPDQANGVPQPSPRRSAQAPKPANDEQPPPLPQPRKKTPRKV
ncbi:T-cell surface antigen CD2 [Amphiprion ocellaris]|uniref:Ig-like domain-containing protein n=1 Tax=Amphiprion ocellaris TaxID=80972 RepID=A0AAQ5YZN9_AMPOC|nr:T-cell surface antigen CD2 [Amphiprion ocellaris]